MKIWAAKVIYFPRDVSKYCDHFEVLFSNLLKYFAQKNHFKLSFFLLFFILALRLLNGSSLMIVPIGLGDRRIHPCRCLRFGRLNRRRLCFSFYEALSSQILLCKIFVSDLLVFFEACHLVLGELLLGFFNRELRFCQNAAEFLQKVSCRNYLLAMILLRRLLLLRHIS